MRLLRLASELFYVATSVLGAFPAFAYSVWGGKFLHSGAALVTMTASVAWVAGGLPLLSKWRRSRDSRMRKLIASIAPSFRPQIEVADYLNTRYVGIDTVTAERLSLIGRRTSQNTSCSRTFKAPKLATPATRFTPHSRSASATSPTLQWRFASTEFKLKMPALAFAMLWNMPRSSRRSRPTGSVGPVLRQIRRSVESRATRRPPMQAANVAPLSCRWLTIVQRQRRQERTAVNCRKDWLS